ncbi:hypothetical protein HDU98_007391 [Podochytrium sp. JEL0797]|nr:hypothetical protein HDU98_007391 [Podochytrium sp. JEL0797]
MSSTISTVCSNLARHSAPAVDEYADVERRNRAAVLMALVLDTATDSVHVLLSRRALTLRTHAGEVAFPGGKMDATDTDAASTATREAHEEIGLPPSSVRIISIHTPAISLHGLVVTPVAGIIAAEELVHHLSPPSENASLPARVIAALTISPAEVESVFSVPLDTFLKADGHEEQHFNATDGSGAVWKLHKFDVVDELGRNYMVWGLTAQILVEFARVAFGREPEFPVIKYTNRPRTIGDGAKTRAGHEVAKSKTSDISEAVL